MKKIACAILGGALMFVGAALATVPPLELHRETAHFRIYCASVDNGAADAVLAQAEQNMNELSSDFNHQYSCAITINLFPSIESFHEAMGQPQAPQWFSGRTKWENRTINLVSPQNPGSYHTYGSIMRQVKVGLVTLFIHELYFIPRWLDQGTALFKAQFLTEESKRELAALAKDPTQLPTLEQLTPIDNTEEFVQHHGFCCSETLVEFINGRWGWDAILELLAAPNRLEEILGVSKETLRLQWADFVVNTYGN